VILGFKRRRPKVPGVLVTVVGATVAVGVFGLAERYGLSVVGPLPKGLPSFQLPSVPARTSGRTWLAPSGSPLCCCFPEPRPEPARLGAGGRGDLGGDRADRGQGVRKLYRVHKTEFALSIVCFLGVAVLGVIEGISIATALALLDFIRRAWRPYDAVLGRVDDVKGYHDVTNAEVFADRLRQAIASSPTPARWAVVAAELITDLDTTAADALRELDRELAAEASTYGLPR